MNGLKKDAVATSRKRLELSIAPGQKGVALALDFREMGINQSIRGGMGDVGAMIGDKNNMSNEGAFPKELLEQIRKRGASISSESPRAAGPSVFERLDHTLDKGGKQMVNPWRQGDEGSSAVQQTDREEKIPVEPATEGQNFPIDAQESEEGTRIVITMESLSATALASEEEDSPKSDFQESPLLASEHREEKISMVSEEASVEFLPSSSPAEEKISMVSEETSVEFLPSSSPAEEEVTFVEPLPQMESASAEEEMTGELTQAVDEADELFITRLKEATLREVATAPLSEGEEEEMGKKKDLITGVETSGGDAENGHQESQREARKEAERRAEEEWHRQKAEGKKIIVTDANPVQSNEAENDAQPNESLPVAAQEATPEATAPVAALNEAAAAIIATTERIAPPVKPQADLAELLREIQPAKRLPPSMQQTTAPESKAAAMSSPPRRELHAEPAAPRTVRAVPVESLGDGVVNLLGDAVGGVVKGSRWVAGAVKGNGKSNGQSVAATPRAAVTGPSRNNGASNRVVTDEEIPVPKRVIIRSTEAVVTGTRGIVSGMGHILTGAVSIVTGTVGCLAGTVACIGRTVVGVVKPNAQPIEAPTNKLHLTLRESVDGTA